MRSASILVLLTVLTLCGCTEKQRLPMPFEPVSQQQIHESVAGYLRRTLAALPPGSVIDGGRFAGAGHNSPCDDAGPGSDTLMRFHTIGELRSPGGDRLDAVSVAGETWRSWGWQVIERDGFGTPNRFGYAPDGFRLQMVTVATGHPVVQASSPCFPRLMARDDVSFPEILTAG